MSVIKHYISTQRASKMSISHSDIDILIRERSPRARSEIAAKIAGDFNAGLFAPAEKAIAYDIFRLLLKDVEVKVRRVLAENLHSNLGVPHDIIMRLASDVADVAIPVLEHSYVLSEDDLVEIIRSTRAAAKLEAIARRASISGMVSGALMDTRITSVVVTLFGNSCASLPEEKVIEALHDMQYDPALLDTLVRRGNLPLTLVEKLFDHVTDELKAMLAAEYNLSSHVADTALDGAREWATLSMITHETDVEDVAALVAQMYATGRLTHSVVLKSLCMGDMRFFEHAMAKLADVPIFNASLLLLDPGGLGFKAMYEAAKMPEGFFDAVCVLHRIALEETGYGRYHQDDFKRRIIQRIIREGHDRNIEHMAYLISLIGHNPSDVTVH